MVAKYGDIRAQIAQIIADNLEGEETLEQLKENDDLTELEINSILFIKIIIGIENQFNIEFDDEALDYSKFVSMENLIYYVQEKL
ncbi:phosphopantetheine-binding protein [Bianquea renquensis]|uniref:Acyl carrier protein n=1 Tax=Bianquea renquensis TaxID=2763661 RepID=A0A926DTU9_9FIRM|nr:phosphopantetheine-binding protein [Bianquea renquensis]MBC8545183.1 acyl carrier protein [Bianquea renquensis]